MEFEHIKNIEVGDIVTFFEKDEYIDYMRSLDVLFSSLDLSHITPDGLNMGKTFFDRFSGKEFKVSRVNDKTKSKGLRVLDEKTGKEIFFWLSSYQVKSVKVPYEDITKLIIT